MSAPSNLPKPPPKAPPAKTPMAKTPAAKQLPDAAQAQAGGPLAKSTAAGPAPSAAPRVVAPKAAGATPGVTPAATLVPKIEGLQATVAQMVESVVMYDDLLREENALLKAQDTRAVAMLQERKMALTRLYQERLRVLLKDDKAMKEVSPEQREKILTLARGLDERAAENAVLLRASMHAIERLFQVVNEAVRKDRTKEVTYSKSGRIDGSASNGSAIAYNTII